MTLKKTLAVGLSAAVALSLAACSSDSSDSASSTSDSSTGGDNYVTANGSEPQNPLIPANTNETGGGRIIDIIYSGLVYYDSEGVAHNELAESIELEGEKTYRVTLRDDITFADGTEIESKHFVDTWNKAVEDSLLNAYFFEPILGYEEGAAAMEGLQIVDEKTFTIELTQAESDFPVRLGYSAFFPLPSEALEDLAAFGEMPVSNGPYKVQEWNHNQDITLVPNENYDGPREAQNDGIVFKFYASQDAAYADLLAGNLDVLDAIPDSAFANYQDDLGDRWVNQPAAIFQSFTIPEKLEHFSGEEGVLRRQALSLAINREEVTKTIFQETRTPATDFSSPVVDGYSESLEGNDVLEFDPERAKELWAQADEIAPFTGKFTLSYNADGGHQAWVDAVTNQIKNNLGIEAEGNPYPDFKSLRDDVTNRQITGAFRTGWQADYPLVSNYLVPLYATGASSNDGDYSNTEFDALLKQGAAAETPEEGLKFYQQAQEILLKELPAIPLWYSNVTGGYSEMVNDVVFNWKSVPEYQAITKN